MPWTYNDYPTSMKNLTAEVRRKAIDIANALLEDGYGDGRAIAIATAQSEKWAKRRHKQIAKKNTGTTGQAIAADDDKGDGESIHVFADPEESGWIATQGQKRVAQGSTKAEVVDKAREQAKAQKTELCIHDKQGDIIEERDYS
ncbi:MULTISPECIES: DUF2188 domain-containing protein [Cyanophyceae]|uniref:DUF2188 domain-containing protein n=1 Tax=Cyanophyceae TaxID=3028117 RepID=UPI001682B47B|nr:MULTISPECIES: DUF2188 domain-containing protein [Cyanophyceae]MBD1918014.1 DUF2188 domain-containing protein [Phormidium sp. FACHB-77]MBD2029262.1 DUF2188 domain-containing protein [Phormidium sp. FACHB-322]MBD2049794.1 DUF2188 domain-containing protein [Leptolyngbya sp. FACHB-60]